MIKYLLNVLLAALIFISCNEAQKQSDLTSEMDTAEGEMKIMIPSSACYSTTTGRDTFLLKVEVFPNVVTGKISYRFHEKDSNEGEFEGKLSGDTLLAAYNFKSEGKLSTRQVIFLIKDDTAIEGHGDMEEKDGKLIFKDIAGIRFEKGLVLKKSPCGEY
ncbi:MAG: hypothetical protein WKI04_02445 [Ferruginibacter sp.]